MIWLWVHIIWFANVLLLVSMYLLGRRVARTGWAINLIGNLIWTAVTASKHQWDYASLSAAFVIIASINLWKAVNYARQPGVQAARDYLRERVQAS